MAARVFSFIHAVHPKDMSHAEWELMIHMLERYDYDKQCSWFRKSYAAEKMSCTEGYVKKLIWTLEDKGYLRVYERVKRHNRYVVPRFPGEILPADVVIHDGPTLTDPDSKEVWTLRVHREKGTADVDEDRMWKEEVQERQRGAADFAAATAKKNVSPQTTKRKKTDQLS